MIYIDVSRPPKDIEMCRTASRPRWTAVWGDGRFFARLRLVNLCL